MRDLLDGTQGFVFDCDGTLLDSMKVWRAVEDELIQMAGGRISPEDFITLQATDIRDGAVVLHERYGAGSSAQALIDYVDSRLLNFYRNEVEPLEGAVELVRGLRERGVPCSVVSSSPMRFLEAGLAHCGMLDAFAAVISTETAGLSKKDTAIYGLAARKMGTVPKACWGVDDSLYALRAMKAAGLRTLGIYGDDEAGSFEDLQATADRALRSFRELSRELA